MASEKVKPELKTQSFISHGLAIGIS